ncbi:MAG: hypothetical protein U1E86_28010 [Burkholderiaceae bacterium]
MNPSNPEHESLVAADRWRLWSSLVRGLSHQLANVAQMMALDDVPPGALTESRERLADTTAALQALRTTSGTAPLLLTPVFDDLDRLQRLQMEFPSAPLDCTLEPGLPALAMRPEDLMHLLLACVTASKRAAGDERLAVRVDAREEGDGVCVTIASPPSIEADPGAAARALAERARGSVTTAPGAMQVRLPAWRRPGA